MAVGGRFTAVAVDPANPQTVYVGSDVAGIFRSRDGGNHFELIGKGAGKLCRCGYCHQPGAAPSGGRAHR